MLKEEEEFTRGRKGKLKEELLLLNEFFVDHFHSLHNLLNTILHVREL